MIEPDDIERICGRCGIKIGFWHGWQKLLDDTFLCNSDIACALRTLTTFLRYDLPREIRTILNER